MTLYNLSTQNIKFTVLESEEKCLKENDYYIEIIINRDFLNNILINYSISYYYGLDKDFSLTKREQEVLKYLSFGFNNTEIAKKLNISVHTTKVHLHNIFNKLSVEDRTEAVVKAIKYNLIDI